MHVCVRAASLISYFDAAFVCSRVCACVRACACVRVYVSGVQSPRHLHRSGLHGHRSGAMHGGDRRCNRRARRGVAPHVRAQPVEQTDVRRLQDHQPPGGLLRGKNSRVSLRIPLLARKSRGLRWCFSWSIRFAWRERGGGWGRRGGIPEGGGCDRRLQTFIELLLQNL